MPGRCTDDERAPPIRHRASPVDRCRVVNRRSADPRTRLLQLTAVLTALSCVPSVAWPPGAVTKATLVVLHLLAAAIIVPVLVRHANH